MFDGVEKLEGLSFPIGFTEATAVHFTRPEGRSLENEMTPRVRFAVSNTDDGWPVLNAMLDFSECPMAEKLGQKSMVVVMPHLTALSLDSLALFLDAMKKCAGCAEDDPPGEVT